MTQNSEPTTCDPVASTASAADMPRAALVFGFPDVGNGAVC